MFVCNVCKKIFPDFKGYGMRMNYRFGYGSSNDGDIFDLTVCDSCADTVATAIESVCAISPHLTVDDAFFPCDEECSGDCHHCSGNCAAFQDDETYDFEDDPDDDDESDEEDSDDFDPDFNG